MVGNINKNDKSEDVLFKIGGQLFGPELEQFLYKVSNDSQTLMNSEQELAQLEGAMPKTEVLFSHVKHWKIDGPEHVKHFGLQGEQL